MSEGGSAEGFEGPAALERLTAATDELRAELAAHRVEVRDALADHLARATDRERAVAAALDALTAQLNQFTGTLASELRRTGEQTVADLGAAVSGDALAEAIGQVDARVAQLAATVGAPLRELVAASSDEVLADEVRRLQALILSLDDRERPVDEGAARLADGVEALRAEIAAVVTGQAQLAADVGDELATLGASLRNAVQAACDQLAASAGELQATADERPAVAAALERALAALDALDTLAQRPDPTPALERLAAQLAARPVAGSDELSDLRAAVDALAARASVTPEDLASLRTAVDALATRPTITPDELAALRGAIVSLHEQPALTPDDLHGPFQSLRDRIDQIAATVGRPAATVADLDPLAARLDRVLAFVADPAVRAEDLQALREAIDSLTAREDAVAGSIEAARFSERLIALDAIRAGVDQLVAWPTATADELERIDRRLDQLATAPQTTTGTDDLRTTLVAITARLDQLATAPHTTGTDDLRTTLDAITARLDDLPATRAAVDAITTRLDVLAAGRPDDDPAGLREDVSDRFHAIDELTAIRQAVDALASRDDLERIDVWLDSLDRLGALRDDLADRLGALDELPGVRVAIEDLASRVADVTDRRADTAAAPPAPSVLGVEDVRDRLDELQAALDRLASSTAPTASPEHAPGLAEQIDAIGRLVHYAVRSLHLIEAATVGVTPRTERDRAAAVAALDALRTVREPAEPAGG